MKLLLVFIITLTFVVVGFAQKGEKSGKELRIEKEANKIELIKNLLDSRNYVFNATHALPMGGSSIFLNSSYDLTIKGDSVYSYLPYFGVAYQAEYGDRNGGIQFEEPVGDYSVESSKSGKQIRFKVKAPKDSYQFLLSVSDLGYANLQVTCNNRQPINFYGTIEEVEKD
jgi:hypothetical protein